MPYNYIIVRVEEKYTSALATGFIRKAIHRAATEGEIVVADNIIRYDQTRYPFSENSVVPYEEAEALFNKVVYKPRKV
jgi:hypothetical protein